MSSHNDLERDFVLPTPSPALTTRPINEVMHEPRPATPPGQRHGDFMTPQETPQGSPSKTSVPPGAFDLPNVFDNAMRLLPTVPGVTPGSPGKAATMGAKPNLSPSKADFTTMFQPVNQEPASPTRKSNKENTPPSSNAASNLRPSSPKKENSHLTQAAQSRAAPYQRTPDAEPTTTAPRPAYVQRGLSREDMEKLAKPSVKRLANVTQLYFLDYYYDLLSYVHVRQNRLNQFKSSHPPPPETPEPEYNDALSKYLGRERANLRKRRTRLRHGDFQILTQVGQGGYGQVYLAQKKDTREVCALKIMSKKLLFKLDEVRHVLTERDILTNANSEWLVRLLYAFQDPKSIYLAMVCVYHCF
jgi:cell cycle protein kinase DBF2